MAISAINYLAEKARQGGVQDDKFFQKILMFFELKVPGKINPLIQGTFLFPLIIPPKSYSLSEPFTVEKTPTQGGGLYVEENGIVQRTLKLSGTTGFSPRKLNSDSATASLSIESPGKKSYTRSLLPWVFAAISGQRHFQYLQDAVFRTYADLKRDPTTAEETKLFFHIPKDDEHWLVIPERFELTRNAAQPTLYNYDIELTVVDAAEANDETFSEDVGLIGAIADAIATVQKAIDLVNGAINDLTAIVSEIKGAVKSIATIIDTATNVIKAAENFVTGVVDLIESPLAIVNSVSELVDEAGRAMDTLEQAQEDIAKMPETVKQKIKEIGNGMDSMSTHPEVFLNLAYGVLLDNLDSLNVQRLLQTIKDKSTPVTAPTTVNGVSGLGTQMTEGDMLIAKGKTTVPVLPILKYRSGKHVSVTDGDTLSSLAARYLGDARRWQDIAIANGLKPPFMNKMASLDLKKTDESSLPGVKGIGDKIIIPSTAKGLKDLPLLPVLGAKPWDTFEAQLLGRDLALEFQSNVSRLGKPLYDIPIDVEGGSIDIKTKAGIDNLKQGLITRTVIERGTDTLYKKLGLDRVNGMNLAPIDIESVRFRISQALRQDARIASIRSIRFLGIDAGTEADPSLPIDALEADIVAEVRGFSESTNVQLKIG